MTIIPTVVIVLKANDGMDAMESAEEILEKSAVQPYGEGPLNPEGRWESFAPGWIDYGMPVHKKTDAESEAIQLKDFDPVAFFAPNEENDDIFIPEALVLADGTWVDAEDMEEGVDWEDYFMAKVENLSKKTWLVFVEADV